MTPVARGRRFDLLPGRNVQELTRVFMGKQQRLNPRAQRGIVAARLIQISLAPGQVREFERPLKDRAFVHGINSRGSLPTDNALSAQDSRQQNLGKERRE